MKYLYPFVFLIALSCKTSKSPSNKSETKIKTDIETTHARPSSGGDAGILDPKQDLMVVLQNPSEITETKELINNSGLVWDKMLLDQNSLKVGLIRVPAGKKDFWLNKLVSSGQFKNVKLYSEKGLKEIVEKEKNTFLSMQKTPCLGDCPTYGVTIDINGKVIFNGIQNTLVKGKNEFQLSEKEFTDLKNKINSKEFANYKSKYDNPKVMDLPSTYITHKGKQVQIRLWGEAPNDLVQFHEFLEGLLLKKKYIN